MIRILIGFFVLFLVSGCGGGSSSSANPSLPNPTQPVVPQLSFTSNIDEATGSVTEGDTVTIIAKVSNTSAPATFNWLQSFGPLVDLQVSSDGSQVTFTAPSIYRSQSEVVELQVNALVDGVDSGAYGANINIINSLTLTDYGRENGSLALSLGESQLQLINITQTIVESFIKNDPDIRLCDFDTVETKELDDNDQSDNLSIGDSINYSSEQCYIPTLDAEGYGRIKMDITNYDAAQKLLVMDVDFSSFFIRDNFDEFKIEGILSVTIEESGSILVQAISNSQPVTFDANGEIFLTVKQSTVTRAFDYNSAKTNVSINAELRDVTNTKLLTVNQVTAFTSKFNQLPNQGELHISDAQETIILDISSSTLSENISFSGENVTEQWRWEDYIEGTLFDYLDAGYGSNSFSNDFQRIGNVSSIFNDENNNVLYQLLFNQPLDLRGCKTNCVTVPFIYEEPSALQTQS
jgi:hypothetical protein